MPPTERTHMPNWDDIVTGMDVRFSTRSAPVSDVAVKAAEPQRLRCRGLPPLAIALFALLVLLVGCAYGSRAPDAAYTPHKDATLATGTLDGHRWSLAVSMNVDEGLCMEVNPQAAQNNDFASGDCGFGASTKEEIAQGSPRTDTGAAETGDGDLLIYGPAPNRATKVVIHSFALRATGSSGSPPSLAIPACHQNRPPSVTVRALHPLPHWASKGQWFVVSAPDNGCGYDTATFYDRDGKVVPQRRF